MAKSSCRYKTAANASSSAQPILHICMQTAGMQPIYAVLSKLARHSCTAQSDVITQKP